MTTPNPTSKAWETFRDPAYYEMHCVRQVGERRFGHGFHLVNGDEAQVLTDLLNAYIKERHAPPQS